MGIGCQPPGDSPHARARSSARPVASSAAEIASKPTAPVDLRISGRHLAASDYRITFEATPRAAVERLDLELLLPDAAIPVRGPIRASFGETPARTKRTLTATVRLHAAGAVVPASARVRVVPGFEPNRMTEVVLGTPPKKAAPPARIIALPSGEVIEEVGP